MLFHINTLVMFESPSCHRRLRYIEHAQNRKDQYLVRLLRKTQGWGVGDPFTSANSSLYMEVLIFTAFTLTLINTPCYIAVEIYVLDVVESLSRW